MPNLTQEQIDRMLSQIAKLSTISLEIADLQKDMEYTLTRLRERDKIVYDLMHPDVQNMLLTAVQKTDLTDSGETSLHTHGAAAPAAHKASHQNSGSDEINVAGLSGELADNQPPKSHALDSHSAPAGNIAMNSKKFTGLVDPSANQDSSTKKYVDDQVGAVESANKSLVATDTLRNSNDTERSVDVGSYTKLKEMQINADLAAVRVKHDMKRQAGITYSKVYVNGSPVGSEHSNPNPTYVEYSDDLANLVSGDLIQIYVYNSVSDFSFVEKMQLHYTNYVTGFGSDDLITNLEIDTVVISVTNQDP